MNRKPEYIVDLLFNNAGITVLSNFENMPEKDWDRVISGNFHGVVNLTRKFLSHLSERPEAAQINTSSIFGIISPPFIILTTAPGPILISTINAALFPVAASF